VLVLNFLEGIVFSFEIWDPKIERRLKITGLTDGRDFGGRSHPDRTPYSKIKGHGCLGEKALGVQ
jgi:hypothetical protein